MPESENPMNSDWIDGKAIGQPCNVNVASGPA